MSRSVERASSGAAALAAALAAVGEAAPIYPLLVLAALHAGGPAPDTAARIGGFLVFDALFAAAVWLATANRRSRRMPSAAGATWFVLGVVGGAASGARGPAYLGLAGAIGLALALRVTRLALRDWRNPVDVSFVVTVLATLGELFLAPVAHAGWGSLFPVAVPQVFAGALASRAASVRIVTGLASLPRPGQRVRPALRPVASAVLAASAALAVVLLASPSGILGRAGRLLLVGIAYAIAGLAVVIALLGAPLFLMLRRLGVGTRSFSRVLDRLGSPHRVTRLGPVAHPGAAQRFLGVLTVLAIVAVLAWLIRGRYRRSAEPEREPPARRAEPEALIALPRRFALPRLRRRRVELPADTVRRWYAESLMALSRRGLPRPAAATPAEHLETVARAYPGAAASFGVLTRAYQSVRYGSERVDAASLAALRERRDDALRVFRSSAPLSE